MSRHDIRSGVAAALPALLLALPLLVGPVACSPSSGDSIDLDDPAELGAVAARIERDPKRADEVLSEAGVTEEELRAAIERTARDPEASRTYMDAFEDELGREVDER